MTTRIKTGNKTLDEVLGGGVAPGSTVLVKTDGLRSIKNKSTLRVLCPGTRAELREILRALVNRRASSDATLVFFADAPPEAEHMVDAVVEPLVGLICTKNRHGAERMVRE